MLKDKQFGLLKFFTSQKVLFLGFFLILCFFLYSYANSKKSSNISGFATGFGDNGAAQPSVSQNQQTVKATPKPMPQPTQQPQQPILQDQPSVTNMNQNAAGYNATNGVIPSELLPKDNNTQFGDFNMINQGNIVMPDLLDAGYLIGLDTIGQTLRNANLQERSDPIIPKTEVGPWNNSTIEPDFARVPLELGTNVK